MPTSSARRQGEEEEEMSKRFDGSTVSGLFREEV
jgi:hypothetical protein